jgi:DNA-binding CsgD family transcriptional regulator
MQRKLVALTRRNSKTTPASPNAVLGKQTGRLIVKKVRAFPRLVQQQKKREANLSNLFVFCEKTTGVAQFRAASNADYDCTVERIAGLLAMQCLVRGQDPGDFEIMVPAEGSFVDRLVSLAQELLKEGRAVACPASLSARQREVLHSVMDNCANKEIAAELNITVRTVKFHISTLLSKFGVESRAELARRAAGFMRPMILEDDALAIERRTLKMRAPDFESMPIETTLRIANKARNVRFPGRVLTA